MCLEKVSTLTLALERWLVLCWLGNLFQLLQKIPLRFMKFPERTCFSAFASSTFQIKNFIFTTSSSKLSCFFFFFFNSRTCRTVEIPLFLKTNTFEVMSFDCYLSLQDPQWFHSTDRFWNAQLIRALFPGALRYCHRYVWRVMCTNGLCKEIWAHACTNTPSTHKDVIMSDVQSRVDVPTPALFPQRLLSLRLWLPRRGNALH